jgi:CheY-like chemotaxis protein
VLVVEDDAAVRRLVVTVLRSAGYNVVEAEDGDAALAIAGGLPEPLALLLSDVVLPDRSGIEIARRVVVLCPGARVLFMSGHAQEALARQGPLLPGSRFLPKPFAPDALLAKVARMLTRSEPR